MDYRAGLSLIRLALFSFYSGEEESVGQTATAHPRGYLSQAFQFHLRSQAIQ